MTDGERRVWFDEWCKDLAKLSDAEIAYACQRYRQNQQNRFFPNSGQLIALSQPAFDQKARRYAPLDDLPPPVPERDALALIERTRAKYGYRADPGRTSVASRQREIAERQPIPHEPSNPDTLAEMRAKLAGKVEPRETIE